MPLLPNQPGSPEADLEIIEPICAVFRRRLKSEGAKYTPERAQVLDAIIRLDGPFDADTLMEHLKEAGYRISKATVYRTIKLLQDTGIVQRVLFEGDQTRYLLVYGRRPADIILRLDTGEAIAIEVPELIAIRDRLCAQHGLRAEGHRFHIVASPLEQ